MDPDNKEKFILESKIGFIEKRKIKYLFDFFGTEDILEH
jgi:hypothetical protein